MAVIASIVMNLQIRNESEAWNAIYQVLRKEKASSKAGSPLVDYRFDTPTVSPNGCFETNVQLYLDVPGWAEASQALHEILSGKTQEAVSTSALLAWYETCLETAEPVPENYAEGDAFLPLGWGELSRFDKSGLSDMLAIIDAAQQGLDNEILNLKPHERRGEGYSEDDYDQAVSIFELANSLREMLVRKMAASDGEFAETSNLPRLIKEDGVDLFEQIDRLPAEIKALVDHYSVELENGCPYSVSKEFLAAVEEHGYTFEYGLDGVPCNLTMKDAERENEHS